MSTGEYIFVVFLLNILISLYFIGLIHELGVKNIRTWILFFVAPANLFLNIFLIIVEKIMFKEVK